MHEQKTSKHFIFLFLVTLDDVDNFKWIFKLDNLILNLSGKNLASNTFGSNQVSVCVCVLGLPSFCFLNFGIKTNETFSHLVTYRVKQY